MVLKLVISLLISSFPSDNLFETYQKELLKTVSSVFKSKEIEFKDESCYTGDLKKVIISKNNSGYLYICSVSSCSLSGCTIPNQNNSNGEYFDLAVILDNNRKILKIKILNYFSDYGYEITSKRFLKKFKNKFLYDFTKQQDDIDIISGATVSCNALENKLVVLDNHFIEKSRKLNNINK